MKLRPLPVLSLFLFTLSIALLNACGGGGGGGGGGGLSTPLPAANQTPVAVAGADLNSLEQAFVELSASGSSDADGNITSYRWVQIDNGQPLVTLTGADTKELTFFASAVTATTTLTFELTVTDNNGATDTDRVDVVVADSSVSISTTVAPASALAGEQLKILNPASTDVILLSSPDQSVELESPAPLSFVSVIDSNENLVYIGLLHKGADQGSIGALSTAISLVLMNPVIADYVSGDPDRYISDLESLAEIRALSDRIFTQLSSSGTRDWSEDFDNALGDVYGPALQAAVDLFSAQAILVQSASIGNRRVSPQLVEVDNDLDENTYSDSNTKSNVTVNVGWELEATEKPEYSVDGKNESKYRVVRLTHSDTETGELASEEGGPALVFPGKDWSFDKGFDSTSVGDKSAINAYGLGSGDLLQTEEAHLPAALTVVREFGIPVVALVLGGVNKDTMIAQCSSVVLDIANGLSVDQEFLSKINRGEYTSAGGAAATSMFGTVINDGGTGVGTCIAQIIKDKPLEVGLKILSKNFLVWIKYWDALKTGYEFSQATQDIVSSMVHEEFALTNKVTDYSLSLSTQIGKQLDVPSFECPGVPGENVCETIVMPEGWPDDNSILAAINFALLCHDFQPRDCYEADFVYGDLSQDVVTEPKEAVPHTYPNALPEDGKSFIEYAGQVDFKDLDHAKGTQKFIVRLERDAPKIALRNADGPIMQNATAFDLSEIAPSTTETISFDILNQNKGNAVLDVTTIRLDDPDRVFTCDNCSQSETNPTQIEPSSQATINLTYTPTEAATASQVTVTVISDDGYRNQAFEFIISLGENTIKAPTSLSAIQGDGSNTLTWNNVAGADSYTLYVATDPATLSTNPERIADVESPYTDDGLVNGTTYFYFVTASRGSEESPPSNATQATPTAAPTEAVQFIEWEVDGATYRTDLRVSPYWYASLDAGTITRRRMKLDGVIEDANGVTIHSMMIHIDNPVGSTVRTFSLDSTDLAALTGGLPTGNYGEWFIQNPADLLSVRITSTQNYLVAESVNSAGEVTFNAPALIEKTQFINDISTYLYAVSGTFSFFTAEDFNGPLFTIPDFRAPEIKEIKGRFNIIDSCLDGDVPVAPGDAPPCAFLDEGKG